MTLELAIASLIAGQRKGGRELGHDDRISSKGGARTAKRVTVNVHDEMVRRAWPCMCPAIQAVRPPLLCPVIRRQGGSVTAAQFRAVLDYLELSQLGVGRLLGVGERTPRR